MTRAEAIQKASDIIDTLIDRAIEEHDYDNADEEGRARRSLERWRDDKLAEIKQELDALVRSMLH